jgi:transposase
MLYVGIDLHKQSLTVCVRNEQGDVVLRRQVSSCWTEIDRFLEALQERSRPEGGYLAILEVCGFHDWLLKRLGRWGCSRAYVVAAPPRVRNKTDRRDAAKLSDLLWINRDRIVDGGRLIELHVVYQPTEQEEAARQLTHLRKKLGQLQTRIKNQIHRIILRHNLAQECPTKNLFTLKALAWLERLCLPEFDRLELDGLLEHLRLYRRQIQQVSKRISQMAAQNATIPLIRTLPKLGEYTALALWAHIGPIARFPTARSLAHYFGITPGCRNSGPTERPGGITKAGHPMIRFLLAQFVVHVLRGDPGLREWYRKIKRRRGSKIARVAVMRRLCEALWHMLTRQEPYRPIAMPDGPDPGTTKRSAA